MGTRYFFGKDEMNRQILCKPVFEFRHLSCDFLSLGVLCLNLRLRCVIPPISYNSGFLAMINAEMHPNV